LVKGPPFDRQRLTPSEVDLKPYVICQGDYLSKLADQFGFDADAVWNDPQNADLKKLRPNPNILFPSDVLQVPGAAPTVTHDLTTGATNTFTRNPPTVVITVKFTDDSLASQPYTVQELAELTGLTTDASGTLSFTAPVTLEIATVVFTASGTTCPINVGHLDPIDTLSGIFHRLRHLGFVDISDSVDLDTIRMALRDFKRAQAGGSSASPDSTDGDPPAPSDPASPASSSQPSDDGSPPASTSPSDPEASPVQDNAGLSDDGSPPASASPSDAGASPAQDNAGLSDDGTLDDATSKQLLAAHGS
jgi:hypothetical protein